MRRNLPPTRADIQDDAIPGHFLQRDWHLRPRLPNHRRDEAIDSAF
jgi:hypothetical protein